MKKNVLVIVTIASQFRALLPIIQLLKKSNSFEPIVLFDENRHDLTNDINYCKKEGVQHISGNAITPEMNNNVLNLHQTVVVTNGFSKDIIKKNKLLDFYSFIYFTKKRALNILTTNKIVHVLSGADVEVEVSTYITVANKLNIPTWVYPFSLSTQKETIGTVSTIPHLRIKSSVFKSFLQLFYKKWVYKFENNYYLPQEFFRIVPMELLGVSPVDPWIYIGGKSKYVLIESEFAANYYKKARIKAERFVEIGATFLCNLYKVTTELKNNRTEVLKRYNLYDNKKIILCALPPIYTDPAALYTDAKDYKTCGEMVMDWVTTITSNKNYQVIVNLHPRSDFEKAKYIEQYGVKIINEDIANLIPLCDLFVANASATIRMALACGKPVLDYDMQNFCYPNYEHLALVTTVYNKKEFHKQFEEITQNNFFEKRIKEMGVTENNYFGKMNCSFDEQFIFLLEKSV